MSFSLLHALEGLEEPRVPGMVQYPLEEILFLVLCGMVCRLEDIEDIELFGCEQLVWFRKFLPFEHGIAPAQTIRRVLARLDGKHLEAVLAQWVHSLCAARSGVVAIDGKAVRGHGALHIVSAFGHEAGLILGATATAGKGYEIAGIKEVLDMLLLEGMIVTMDALGTQSAIIEAIIHKKGDYVLALKGNQGTLHEDVVDFFDDPALAGTCATSQEADSGHGRIEHRTVYAADAAWLANRHPQFAGLASIAMLKAVREDKKSGKISQSTRYYISSLGADPKLIAHAARAHWSVENNAHWSLDVIFNEDKAKHRKDHEPRNLATIRRMALNLLKKNPDKIPLKRKRTKAAFNPDYRTKIFAVNDS